MRLSGIYIAVPTTEAIVEIANQQIGKKKASKEVVAVPIEVKAQTGHATKTLNVTFYDILGRFLHGRTSDGEHVIIRLGPVADRGNTHPSVIVSVSETTKSVAHRPTGPANGTTKRR